ncbi:flavodoxin domain-containing protein [Thermomonospora cellulosilytica]|uniref:Menaquinone-dependent protoporphyrinogen oxidase n=1 Tax=Thermomonospora cellulosilytica TaxID=1411118 RepID=A0A7W3MVR0_9ACTN|nr:flavodoxin domain-containing protein [Thermomonospora cellulosilytica]MBA9002783.1 menaquinone-dependent protoporphyrinogen oxidase [Thermomonospora cellulosilytica]
MFVFIGYASAHGSTQSIAERIATRLAEHGHRTDAADVGQDRDVTGYEAFVIGSAVHRQAWLKEAVDFLDVHRGSLQDRPVWLFSVGMPAALRGPWRRWARKEEAVLSAKLRGSIQPRDHHLFSGVYRREHTNLAGHLIGRVMGVRYGDYRDWRDVDAWADGIDRRLKADTISRPRRT